MKQDVFGQLPDGREVSRFTLSNSHGLQWQVSNFGGTWLNLLVPDRHGKPGDVLLGFDRLEACLSDHPFMNTLIGRVGNRIARGRFSLDGQSYQLPLNLPPHHLHGGASAWDKQLWEAEDVSTEEEDRLRLTYVSADGEMGYPGEIRIEVTHTLTQANEVRLDYQAQTNKTTVLNPTHHAYFNLAGTGDIRNHELMLKADQIIAADAEGIPLPDALMEVAGTPFDFRHPASLGERLDQEHSQLTLGQGFDRCFVVKDWDGKLGFIGRVYDPASGRAMHVHTTEPGVQLYTANFLEGVVGKGGVEYKPYMAFCLETQHHPDSPNRPEFPSTVLRPGEVFRSTTVYQFE